MGVDLTLLVVDGDMGDSSFSHTMLDLGRRAELWEVIYEIEERYGEGVPKSFYTYLGRNDNDELCYGVTKTTPYGEELKYVSVRHLKPLAANQSVVDHYKNKAAWAYLEQLPDHTKIALFWH